jgi:hypothetical protein
MSKELTNKHKRTYTSITLPNGIIIIMDKIEVIETDKVVLSSGQWYAINDDERNFLLEAMDGVTKDFS